VKNRLDEVLKDARRYLHSHRVPEASANAEFLLSHLVGYKRLELYVRGDSVLTAGMCEQYKSLLDRRAKREPLPYLIGEQEFAGLRLKVTPDVLIPRPETELLVRKATLWISRMGSKSVIDVGTGSGGIAISMARSFPHLKVYAVDICPRALKVARENGRINEVLGQVRWVQGDLLTPDPVSGLRTLPMVDAIISNPPYVARETLETLTPEVRAEPRAALDGGPGGTEVIERLIVAAPAKLKKGGFLLLEFGFGQAPAVQSFLKANGFSDIRIEKDHAGIERFAFAVKA
jgi:release factor glutamine methyltransferase